MAGRGPECLEPGAGARGTGAGCGRTCRSPRGPVRRPAAGTSPAARPSPAAASGSGSCSPAPRGRPGSGRRGHGLAKADLPASHVGAPPDWPAPPSLCGESAQLPQSQRSWDSGFPQLRGSKDPVGRPSCFPQCHGHQSPGNPLCWQPLAGPGPRGQVCLCCPSAAPRTRGMGTQVASARPYLRGPGVHAQLLGQRQEGRQLLAVQEQVDGHPAARGSVHHVQEQVRVSEYVHDDGHQLGGGGRGAVDRAWGSGDPQKVGPWR